MNKYLNKVAQLLSHENKEDLKNTAGIMAMGTVMGGAANHLNQKLGLLGHAAEGGKWFHGKNLAAAGVAGALGGVADFAALKMHRAMSHTSKEQQ
jgi:hypothetical protein